MRRRLVCLHTLHTASATQLRLISVHTLFSFSNYTLPPLPSANTVTDSTNQTEPADRHLPHPNNHHDTRLTPRCQDPRLGHPTAQWISESTRSRPLQAAYLTTISGGLCCAGAWLDRVLRLSLGRPSTPSERRQTELGRLSQDMRKFDSPQRE